jgi:hypothetical protein
MPGLCTLRFSRYIEYNGQTAFDVDARKDCVRCVSPDTLSIMDKQPLMLMPGLCTLRF